jgi:cytochrome P450
VFHDGQCNFHTEISGCPVATDTTLGMMLGWADTAERCLGSHLARMETRVVLEEWQARVPGYRVRAVAGLVYGEGPRQVDDLPPIWET